MFAESHAKRRAPRELHCKCAFNKIERTEHYMYKESRFTPGLGLLSAPAVKARDESAAACAPPARGRSARITPLPSRPSLT